MAYYNRRRRYGAPATPKATPKHTGPIVEVDMETLLRSAGAASSQRARTTTVLTASIFNPARWQRNTVTMYDGRSKTDRIEAGRIVIVTYEKWGWRISTSATSEPTPMMICQGAMPVTVADKIAESGGMILYQTPESILVAAQYQATRNRRSIALAMLDEAITLKGKHATEEQITKIDKKYQVFCNLAARALGGSHLESEGLTDAVNNEAMTAWNIAIKRGESLIQGEWS